MPPKGFSSAFFFTWNKLIASTDKISSPERSITGVFKIDRRKLKGSKELWRWPAPISCWKHGLRLLLPTSVSYVYLEQKLWKWLLPRAHSGTSLCARNTSVQGLAAHPAGDNHTDKLWWYQRVALHQTSPQQLHSCLRDLPSTCLQLAFKTAALPEKQWELLCGTCPLGLCNIQAFFYSVCPEAAREDIRKCLFTWISRPVHTAGQGRDSGR